MATPKVFISSTCYDLGEVRDALATFIKDYGFDPVISEHGDVFYHPDLHTHEACLHEVSNCQMLVLVVGGRFGGRYLYDKAKSVTNAEYEAAKKSEIPIFAFVKKEVLESERLYRHKTNKDKNIDFPAIEKQEDAPAIFDFIADVRGATKNNGYFPFERSQEIVELLRRQWAGLFFEFLRSRQLRMELESQRHLLNALLNTSDKLEELTKKIYTFVDKSDDAKSFLKSVDVRMMGFEFLSKLFMLFDNARFSILSLDQLAEIEPAGLEWWEYLEATGNFILSPPRDDGSLKAIMWYGSLKGTREFGVGFDHLSSQIETSYFEGFRKLGYEERKKVLSPWTVGPYSPHDPVFRRTIAS